MFVRELQRPRRRAAGSMDLVWATLASIGCHEFTTGVAGTWIGCKNSHAEEPRWKGVLHCAAKARSDSDRPDESLKERSAKRQRATGSFFTPRVKKVAGARFEYAECLNIVRRTEDIFWALLREGDDRRWVLKP